MTARRFDPDLLTQLEVCQRIGISDETWRRWRKRGLTPAPVQNLPPHSRPKWRVADIDAFINDARVRLARREVA